MGSELQLCFQPCGKGESSSKLLSSILAQISDDKRRMRDLHAKPFDLIWIFLFLPLKPVKGPAVFSLAPYTASGAVL